jgi:WD40 repeat protein
MLVASADPATGEPWVEVSHEALIRGWPRLRDWIDKGRAGLRVHRRLTEAADDWERSGQDEAMLYQGFRLAEAAEWLEGDPGAANEREREFVAAGLGARDRAAKRRRRRLAIVAAALMLGIVLAGGAALIAIQQRNTADREKTIAESRSLASKAIDLAPGDPQRSLQIALEAAHKARTDEARDALRTALSQPQPRFTVPAAPASDARVSPDGRLLLTLTEEGEVRLWDVRTGRLKKKLDTRRVQPTAIAFSQSSRLIATGGKSGAAIWSASGRLIRTVRVRVRHPLEETPSISDYPFSPDEHRLVLGSGAPEAVVYDLTTHRRDVLPAPGSAVEDGQFSPDGRFVAASTSENSSRLWNVGTRRGVHVRGWAPEFSPDGHRLLTAGGARPLLSAVPSGHLLARLHADNAEFSRDGRLVLSSSPHGTTAVSANDGSRVPRPLAGVPVLRTRSFSPDGRFAAFRRSEVTSAVTGDLVQRYPASGRLGLEDAEIFNAKGDVLLTSDDQGVHVWPTPSWNATRLGTGTGHVVAVGTGPQLWVAAAIQGSSVRVWHGPLSPVDVEAPHANPVLKGVRSVGISSDGRLIGVVRRNGRLEVWRESPWQRLSSSRRLLPLLQSPDRVLGISDDGRTAATRESLDMTVWDTRTGRRLRSREEDEEIQGATIVLSADGRQVANSGSMQTAQATIAKTTIWDSRSGKVISTVRNQDRPVAFSHDGRRVLTVGEDGTARVSDPSSGRQIGRVSHGVRPDITAQHITPSASLSQDGNFVTAVGADGVLQVWDARTGRPVARLPLRPGTSTVAFGSANTIVTAGGGTVHTATCEVCGSFEELLRLARTRLAGPAK